jgi:hypothetical protein
MFFNTKIFHFLLNNKTFSNNVVINNKINNNKIISISPGGYKGFYELGVCKYIKENYNLDNYIFSGASAGSWNSLLLCYKGKFSDIENKLLDNNLYKTKTIWELEKFIKNKILNEFKTEQFHLDKLFIGATTISGLKTTVTIYSNFIDLEDAVNCCVASSHIPFITGGCTYRNTITFDGGFSREPYLNNGNIVLNITPNIWKDNNKKKYCLKLSDYTTLFSRSEFNFNEMIEQGYRDSYKNKEYLDKIFQIND